MQTDVQFGKSIEEVIFVRNKQSSTAGSMKF